MVIFETGVSLTQEQFDSAVCLATPAGAGSLRRAAVEKV